MFKRSPLATCYVFLANDEASYIGGQVLLRMVATSSVPRNPAEVAASVPDAEKEPVHA